MIIAVHGTDSKVFRRGLSERRAGGSTGEGGMDGSMNTMGTDTSLQPSEADHGSGAKRGDVAFESSDEAKRTTQGAARKG